MATFTDSQDRRWVFDITIGGLTRLKAAGIDLLNITEPRKDSKIPLLTELETDLLVLCEAAYGLLQPQIEKSGLSHDQFAEGLDGKASAAMHGAFWSALTDFFQSRGEVQKVAAIQKMGRLVTAATSLTEKRINEIDTDLLLSRMVGVPSTN